MFSLISNLLKQPFISNVLTRLGNRWTAHGLVIILLQLEELHIIPGGSRELVDGLPMSKVLPYLVIAVGIYFIGKMPSKADKANNRVAYLKAQIEVVKLEKELEELKGSK